MRRTLRLLALLTTTAALLAAPAVTRAEPAVALDGTQLTFFDTTSPTTFVTRSIAGLPSGGTTIAAMDVRPADGNLYVITIIEGGGANDATGQLWKIDLDTAVATQVGSPFSSTLFDNGFWGMDFNPVADRIRVVEGQSNDSYRVNPTNGTLVAQDADLSVAGIFDVAYDRDVIGATATTAFAIDYSQDKLWRLGGVDGAPSANTGVLTEIGPLGTSITNAANFDISPSTGTAFLLEGTGLFTVNLTTGAATSLATLTFPAADGVALLGASTIAVGAATATVTEAGGAVALTVTRTGVTNKPEAVSFATADGTATAGSDYTAVSGTLTFAAGETSRTVYVPVSTDAVNDGGETFTLTLSSPTGNASLGASTATTVTITQETTKPVVLAPALAARTFSVLTRFGLTARFSVSEASRTTATLKYGTRVIGTVVPRTTSGAAITTVKATLTPRGRNILRSALAASRTGRVAVVLTLRTVDNAGNVRNTPVRVVVRR